MKFRKYEFTPTQWATAKKKIELTETNPDGETYSYWNPELIAIVYEIGKLCTEWETNEEDMPICVKQSTKISVDIVWQKEELSDFDKYMVFPIPVGVSSMGDSLDKEYTEAYCVINPDYCKPKGIIL
jgi:hypothetical protein